MTTRAAFTIAGSFCTSFGALLVSQVPSAFGYWTGTAMVILGPLFIGAIATEKK